MDTIISIILACRIKVLTPRPASSSESRKKKEENFFPSRLIRILVFFRFTTLNWNEKGSYLFMEGWDVLQRGSSLEKIFIDPFFYWILPAICNWFEKYYRGGKIQWKRVLIFIDLKKYWMCLLNRSMFKCNVVQNYPFFYGSRCKLSPFT